MPMEFEWDENKAKSNRVKHGIRFEDAVLLFDDPQHLSQQERIENGEYRWQTLRHCGYSGCAYHPFRKRK